MRWHDSLRCNPEPGATNNDIVEFQSTVFANLTATELSELHEQHQLIVGEGCFDPPFCPQEWVLPKCKFPPEYLKLLQWSNGGFFEGLKRDLDPLFSTEDVREYLLSYSVPHWMPLTCPLGFDGGGGFYLFDMRMGNSGLDYPILWAHAGALSFEESEIIAPSFSAFINSSLGE